MKKGTFEAYLLALACMVITATAAYMYIWQLTQWTPLVCALVSTCLSMGVIGFVRKNVSWRLWLQLLVVVLVLAIFTFGQEVVLWKLLSLNLFALALAIIWYGISLLINKGVQWQSVFWFLLGASGSLYVVFSFYLHSTFRTAAWDLGDYSQGVWLLSRFMAANNTVIGVNNLGDHFELPLVYLAPLYWLYSSPYVLLFVQAMAIAFGAVPLYLLVKKEWGSCNATILSLSYFCYFGFQSALGFDFHPIVLAVPWVSLAIYSLHQEKYRLMLGSLLMILITKENLALYVACFGLYLLCKRKWIFGVAIIVGSVAYLVLLTELIMPWLSGGEEYIHFDYDQLGSSYSEVVVNVLKNPLLLVEVAISPEGKVHTFMQTLGSFGFFPLLSGGLVLLLAGLGERWLNSLEAIWSTSFQYSALFGPYMTYGSFLFIRWFSSLMKRYNIVLVEGQFVTVLVLYVALSSFSYAWKGFVAPYPLIEFVSGGFKTDEISFVSSRSTYQGLTMIPEDATVMAQDALVSHLSERDVIYLLEKNNIQKYQPDFVVINLYLSSWPLTKEELFDTAVKYEDGSSYEVLFAKDGFYLFRRLVLEDEELTAQEIPE